MHATLSSASAFAVDGDSIGGRRFFFDAAGAAGRAFAVDGDSIGGDAAGAAGRVFGGDERGWAFGDGMPQKNRIYIYIYVCMFLII
jgi:hypothetical protein